MLKKLLIFDTQQKPTHESVSFGEFHLIQSFVHLHSDGFTLSSLRSFSQSKNIPFVSLSEALCFYFPIYQASEESFVFSKFRSRFDFEKFLKAVDVTKESVFSFLNQRMQATKGNLELVCENTAFTKRMILELVEEHRSFLRSSSPSLLLSFESRHQKIQDDIFSKVEDVLRANKKVVTPYELIYLWLGIKNPDSRLVGCINLIVKTSSQAYVSNNSNFISHVDVADSINFKAGAIICSWLMKDNEGKTTRELQQALQTNGIEIEDVMLEKTLSYWQCLYKNNNKWFAKQ